MSPDGVTHQHGQLDCLEWDSGYLEYLKDARRGVEICSWACRDWSAPYDGENPSANTAPPPPLPPTSNPSLAMFPEHFSLQHSGGSETPPGQQRAAVVAVARSEWSSSERESGEWDVTIGENNCISLTTRSKKCSLQREEFLPKPVPPLIPSCSSDDTSSGSRQTSSAAPHIPATAITVSYQAVYNGPIRPDNGCSRFLDENANGSIVTCTSQTCPTLSQSMFTKSDSSNATSHCTTSLSQPNSDTSYLQGALSDLPEANNTQQSVESLIKELLEQAPGDPQLPGDSNGQGISIEAFTQELRELEKRVKERGGSTDQQEEVAVETQEEDPALPGGSEAKVIGSYKAEPSAASVCSPEDP